MCRELDVRRKCVGYITGPVERKVGEGGGRGRGGGKGERERNACFGTCAPYVYIVWVRGRRGREREGGKGERERERNVCLGACAPYVYIVQDREEGDKTKREYKGLCKTVTSSQFFKMPATRKGKNKKTTT